MRTRATWLGVMCSMAFPAIAQITQPTPPTAPTTPTVATGATTIPTNADIAAKLQKLTGKNSQQSLAQVVVIGSLLGCTQKTAGKEATASFYKQMEAVGKQAETYCRAGKAEDARSLLLTTFTEQHTSPVVKAALDCYDAQAETVAAIGGARMAADAAHYARWMRDPTLAQNEMQTSDICRGTPKANKQPNA